MTLLNVSDGIEESTIAKKYYDDPLINIIKFACNACPEKKVFVTNACQGCLSHQCTEVCPKDAIHIVNGKSCIDQEKCIKCGRCMDACPYHAITKLERPCAASCGMDAIKSDADGKAVLYNDTLSAEDKGKIVSTRGIQDHLEAHLELSLIKDRFSKQFMP